MARERAGKPRDKRGAGRIDDAPQGAVPPEVAQILYHQANCLDEKDWPGFIALFADDGIYWMPAAPEQTTGDGTPSIFYEDRNLMTVRMKRLEHPRAWSLKTDWITNHVVSNAILQSHDPETPEMVVRSRFHMMEFRNDETRHFAGSYLHHFTKTGRGYRIKLQRVDIINAQGAFDYVLQAWV